MMNQQKSGSYRTTISIPQDLKRRMDKDGPDVNWSAIAATAFEVKLAEIVAKKAKKNMADVIQRLRASKQQGEAQVYQDGFAEGQEWAKDRAEALELQRLERFRESLRNLEWDLQFKTSETDAYGVSDRFVWMVRPETEGARELCAEFWEQAIGEVNLNRIQEDDFVRGFAEGALDVWAEVKSEL
jgi:hypothetical protein